MTISVGGGPNWRNKTAYLNYSEVVIIRNGNILVFSPFHQLQGFSLSCDWFVASFEYGCEFNGYNYYDDHEQLKVTTEKNLIWQFGSGVNEVSLKRDGLE